jgi:peptidoglycan/LPS O-acetylase OafA/YrhL
MLAVIVNAGRFHEPYNVEMLVGIIVGLPAVAFLTRFPYRKVDELFGNVSYGVYLNHMSLIWIFAYFGADPLSWWQAAALITVAFLWSWATYRAIERPVIRLRHGLRRKESAGRAVARQPAAELT